MVRARDRLDQLPERPAWPARLSALGGLLVPVLALVWWWLALRAVGPVTFTDLGLVSLLPAAAYLPGLVLIGHFVALLARERLSVVALAAHLAALVVVIQGTLPALYDAPRFVWTYKHLGMIEYIAQRGEVDANIDAYHNWPGFFALFAGGVQFSGWWNALGDLASWAPVYFDLLYLLPLLVIFRRLTSNPRLPWLALLIFVLSNWTNQDYFAPQALGYLLAFLALAVTLSVTPLRARATGLGAALRARVQRSDQRLAVAVGAGVMGALASSHQLTPFMLLGFLLSLAVTGTWRYLSWLALAAGLTAAWLSLMAAPFMRAHSDWLDALGRLGENLQLNLGPELSYSAEHSLVLQITQLAIRLLWLLALLGGVRLLLGRRLIWPLVGLAAAPLPMIALGSYGGEMLLRIYFFSLPFVALLAATALLGERPRAPRRWELGVALGLTWVMFGTLQFSAFGYERTNRVPAADVRTARALYRTLPPDSALVVFSVDSFPIKLTATYPQVVHLQLVDNRREALVELIPEILQALREQLRNAGLDAGYLVFSDSQRVYMDKFRLLQAGSYERFAQIVAREPSARLVYRSGETRVYRLEAAPRGGTP